MEHSLALTQLLTLTNMAGLAAVLPASQVDWNSGRLGITDDPSQAPGNGLTAIETALMIDTCESWIAFRHVGRIRDFAPLVEAATESLRPVLRASGIRMIEPRCDVYLSSPHAVTPCHIDHQSSVLLQVRGHKSISTFDPNDREILPKERLEHLTARGERNHKINRRFLTRGQTFPLKPGTGLYLPAHSPHYVRNGSEASLSISLTFGTEATNTQRALLAMNHRLRKLGMTPREPGSSTKSDAMKVAAFHRLGRLERALRKRA